MGTPLYNTDIIPLTSRPTLTVMDDGDYFVILDTSTGKISKILKTNIMTALNITYDNTSGLTAENVQTALDELVVNLGSSDSAILALAGRLDTLEGTGYTEGSLKSHEDRLDTLEGTGEGSVAKAIADAVSPLAEVVDTNRLYSDSQYLKLKAKADAQALEIQASRAELYNGYKILQFGSTDIIGKGTKADYSAIDVSANVVDGSLSMEQKGMTITNLVNGASIANLGTVTFASILNDKYYDTLNNAILTGTGSDMTATNNSGATANMAIYHLNAHGLQAITDTAILAKLLPYVDGTANVGKMGIQILDADDNATQTIFLPTIGNSLPNGVVDSIKTVSDGWEHTKRVSDWGVTKTKTTLVVNGVNGSGWQIEGFTSVHGIINSTNIDTMPNMYRGDSGLANIYAENFQNSGWEHSGANGEAITIRPSTAYFYVRVKNSRTGVVDGDSNAIKVSKVQSWLRNNPITFIYQLANPITTHYDLPLPTSGKTVHRFAGEEKIALYGTGLTFSENVLSVLSAVKFVSGEMTDITDLATITTNTVTFSGVSATDVVYVKVEHSVNRPLGILEHTPAVSNTASRLAAIEAWIAAQGA